MKFLNCVPLSTPKQFPRLRKEWRLIRIAIPALFSRIALGMQFLAETWATHSIRNSTTDVSFVVFAGTIPVVLLSPFAGRLVDHHDRRHLSAFSDSGRALLWLSGGLLVAISKPSLSLFVLLELLTASITALYEPAYNALVAELVNREETLRVNSWLAACNQVGLLSGAAFGGLLIGLGAQWVMIGSASLLALGAIATLRLRSGTILASGQIHAASLARMREATHLLARNRGLLTILCAYLLLMSTLRTINTLLVPFCRDSLVSCSGKDVAIIDGGFALGGILGALALIPTGSRLPERATMVFGCLCVALSLAFLSVARSVAQATLSYVAMGAVFQIRALFQAIVLARTPTFLHGRVLALFFLGVSALGAVVPLAIGLSANVVSGRALLDIQACLVAVAAVLVLSGAAERRLANA